jgi:hypothetical protein
MTKIIIDEYRIKASTTIEAIGKTRALFLMR